MPSDFDTQFAEAASPTLLDQFGQSITYTPSSGDAVTLTAIVGAEVAHEEDMGEGRKLVRTREIVVGTDPDATAGGVASPTILDTVTVGTVTYAVRQIDYQTHALTKFETVRTEDMQRSREGYRRR